MRRLMLLTATTLACQPAPPLDPALIDEGADPWTEDTVETTTTDIPFTRSGVTAVGRQGEWTWVADPDNGTVYRLDHTTGEADGVEVGDRPTRLVRHGDQLWVTVRGDGDLVALTLSGATARETARLHLGGEPFDVAVSPDGARLFVSLSTADQVVELRASDLSEVGRWTVAPEPRWLALTADRVWVSSVRGAAVHELDPATGAVTDHALPSVRRFRDPGCEDRRFIPRPSGEIAVDDTTGLVYAVAWYADVLVTNPSNQDVEIEAGADCDQFDPADAPSPNGVGAGTAGVYTGFPPSIDPNPTLTPRRYAPVLVEIDPVAGTSAAFILNWYVSTSTIASTAIELVRGIPTALEVVPSAEGPTVYVSMESTSNLVAIRPRVEGDPGGAGAFRSAHRFARQVGAGPSTIRRIGVDGDQVSVWHWLDRELQLWPMGAIDPDNAAQFDENGAPVDDDWMKTEPDTIATLPRSVLDERVRSGRELFFRADLEHVSLQGAGASCSACHADGASDGLTWIFDDFPRQTPTLAGVAGTEPVTWTGEVATIREEAMFTAQIRMGGLGLSDRQGRDLERFVESLPAPILPEPPEAEAALAAEGAEIFRRPDVGCATCHSDEAGASAQIVPIFGLPAVNVPMLRGISRSAPYLHDGSAATLREVLVRSRTRAMGDTSRLSDHEMDALEAFLRTL